MTDNNHIPAYKDPYNDMFQWKKHYDKHKHKVPPYNYKHIEVDDMHPPWIHDYNKYLYCMKANTTCYSEQKSFSKCESMYNNVLRGLYTDYINCMRSLNNKNENEKFRHCKNTYYNYLDIAQWYDR